MKTGKTTKATNRKSHFLPGEIIGRLVGGDFSEVPLARDGVVVLDFLRGGFKAGV